MSSTDNWTAIMVHGGESGHRNFDDFPEYSPDTLETDDQMISPRSMNDDHDILAEIQVDSTDSISQRNVNIHDVDEDRPRYVQNHSNYTNNYAHQIHSPRSQRYRSVGKSQAMLSRIITVPEPNTPASNHVTSGHQHAKQPMYETLRDSQATMRGIPSQYGGGSMRGYPMNQVSTIGHMSLRRTFPKEYPRGSVAFRRHHHERKEYNITQFEVVLDRHEKHMYLPGEEIVGKVIFDIARDTEVRFIELLIVGQSSATFVHNHNVANAKTKRDVFLTKRSYITGRPDSRHNSLIKPGHYVSNFRFQLPDNIPSSLKYEDKISGFGMDVVYLVKARICDEVGASSARSTRSTHSVNNYIKVLISRRQMFSVKRPFDIHSIPMALTPVSHTEDMPVSCSIFSTSQSASIFLSMDRTCFLAGDDIRVHLETFNKHARKIKKISCLLEQKVLVKGVRSQAIFQIANIEQRSPKGNSLQRNKQNVTFYDVLLPTHTTFLPSILPGCRLVRVGYNLVVIIKFKACRGKLTLDIPISIGPCIDQIGMEKRNSTVPMFNKPLRFPYFSPHSSSGATSNGDAWSVQEKYRHHVKVKAKHSYGTCSSKFCCCLASETLI